MQEKFQIRALSEIELQGFAPKVVLVRGVGRGKFSRSCQSAIQQTASLRYFGCGSAALCLCFFVVQNHELAAVLAH
jgi:hypothetical protein